jgi:hypothetical protein
MTWQYTIEWHQPRDGNVDTDAQKASIDAKKVNNNNNNNNNRKNIVTVTSKPRSQMESSLITISTWTSSSSNSTMMMTNSSSSSRMEVDNSTMKVVEDEEEYQPLAVFVQVLRGGSPILGARVMMNVEVELGNGSVVALAPVQLSDDGFGGEKNLLLIHFSIIFFYFSCLSVFLSFCLSLFYALQ